MRRGPAFVPAMLSFSPEASRHESWGRLLELSSGSAVVSTPAKVTRGELVLLSFKLGVESFAELRCRAVHVETDVDGRPMAELRFLDQVDRRRLAQALTDLLSR